MERSFFLVNGNALKNNLTSVPITTIVLHTVLYWEQMEPSGRTILIFQPKGRLFKSEFGVGGLQTKMIFVYLVNHNMFPVRFQVFCIDRLLLKTQKIS